MEDGDAGRQAGRAAAGSRQSASSDLATTPSLMVGGHRVRITTDVSVTAGDLVPVH